MAVDASPLTSERSGRLGALARRRTERVAVTPALVPSCAVVQNPRSIGVRSRSGHPKRLAGPSWDAPRGLNASRRGVLNCHEFFGFHQRAVGVAYPGPSIIRFVQFMSPLMPLWS